MQQFLAIFLVRLHTIVFPGGENPSKTVWSASKVILRSGDAKKVNPSVRRPIFLQFRGSRVRRRV